MRGHKDGTRKAPRKKEKDSPGAGQLPPAEVERIYAEERAHRRRAGYCYHDGEAAVRCPDCGQDLAEELARALEGWRLLWTGTLNLLWRQDRRAYRRLLKAFERHGLTGLQFPSSRDRAEHTSGGPIFRLGRGFVGQRTVPPSGPQRGFPPSDAVLELYRAFAQDRRPVSMRGRVKSTAPPPPAVLVHAVYQRVHHHLPKARPGRLHNGDDTPEACTLAALRKHFPQYTEKSLHNLVKRGRREGARLYPAGSKAARALGDWLDVQLGFPLTFPPK